MSSRYRTQKYQSYLQSEIWENKRQYLFDLLGRTCELCGSNKIIQVHHLTYERLYQERKSDLLLLCSECHKKADVDRKANNTQKTFAHWVYRKYGDSWRGKISFLDIAIPFALEVYDIKTRKITGIFGVEL